MYPTASAPQYAFGPGLAPVSMPGMARGGLAALANQYRKGGRIRYYEEGGETGGADSSTEGGAGAAFGGSDPGPGPGSSTDPGVGVGGGGGTDPGAAAQAAAQAVDNAVDFGVDVDAAQATLGAQVAAEEDEAQQTQAAETAAALGAQANAIAAEARANAEEDAKAAMMAAVMRGEVEGFPGPQAQASKGYNATLQNPLSLSKPFFGIMDPFLTIDVPFMNQPIEMTPFGVAAPALGKGAQAVSAGITAGKALGFAEGGLAAAQQAQSKGRGQDTMLVHMTPGEVKGLQALAMSQGGSLTINPQTGLPEAGFLSAILPMIAGFALGPAGFGLMSSALGAGAVVGGLTGLATGSLKKGLMAGLGAYGGFGLGEGLTAAATPMEAATTQVAQAPTSAFNLAQSNIDPSILESGLGAGSKESIMQQAMQSPAYQQALTSPQLGSSALDTMSAADVAQAKVLPGQMITTTPAIPAPAGFEAATSGFENVFKPAAEGGAEYRKAFGAALPYGTTMAAAAPLAAEAAKPPKGPEPSKSYIRGYDLDITNPSGTPQYTPQDTREREQVRYAFSPRPIYEAAQGGLAALNGQTYDDEYGRDEYEEGGSVKKRKSRSLKGNPYYKFAQDRRDSSMEAAVEQNFAKGGLPPRFLSGGGDGMSDSIKARIGGVQEARLADGEFVVPADVVSHLGNGSSKAGAKKLYAMMDKIRKARTGRTRQAPEVNARRYMPA